MRKNKLPIVILLITCLLFLSSCKEKQESGVSEDSMTYDITAAQDVVMNYFKYFKNKDYENIKRICTQDIIDNVENMGSNKLKMISYKVYETLELNKYGIFKIKVVSIRNDKPYVLLEEYVMNVIKQNDGYKISEVKISQEKEVFTQNDEIRIRDKNNVETNVVIYIEDIPNFITNKQDKLKIYKNEIPKKYFGNMTISYDGVKLAMSTYDTNSYIALININESLAMQTNSDTKGGVQGSSGEEQGKEQEKGTREISIGKDIISLDFIKDNYVDLMVFSNDMKFIALQYSDNKTSKCLRVYDIKSEDLIPVAFEKSFPIDKVNVIFSSFDDKYLNFEVINKGKGTIDNKEITGRYKMDLSDFKIEKI